MDQKNASGPVLKIFKAVKQIFLTLAPELMEGSHILNRLLLFVGIDPTDPEKEKMGILALQIKERDVLHSVRPHLRNISSPCRV